MDLLKMKNIFLMLFLSLFSRVAAKGGGGSGSVGSYGSGAASGAYRGNNGHNSGASEDSLILAIVVVAGLTVFICALCVGFYYNHKKMEREGGIPATKSTKAALHSERTNTWNEQVQTARDQVLHSNGNIPSLVSSPFWDSATAIFEARYTDSTYPQFSGLKALGKFIFDNTGDENAAIKMIVGGSGKDRDQQFVIIQGAISSSGQAYWVERRSETSTTALITGRFSAPHLFTGEWAANNGATGTFVSFKIIQMTRLVDVDDDRTLATEIEQGTLAGDWDLEDNALCLLKWKGYEVRASQKPASSADSSFVV